MKILVLIIFALLAIVVFQQCTPSKKGTWKSKHTSLRLKFDENWNKIPASKDSKSKVIVGLQDPSDHSAIVIKIVGDVPHDVLSNDEIFEATRAQMLAANEKNELLLEDNIEFKGKTFNRMIFNMHTKYGELTQVAYTHRNGYKSTTFQIMFRKELADDPAKRMPDKIEKVLADLEI